MQRNLIILSLIVGLAATNAAAEMPEYGFVGSFDLTVDGKPWLRTVTTPYDSDRHEETYKVFTHIMDFEGEYPLTKGIGGKFTHHRGLFIGWRETRVGDGTYDTWHMEQCTQQHVAWNDTVATDNSASIVEQISWGPIAGMLFLSEERTLTARASESSVRVFDFQSRLRAESAPVELKGDLQHAGMQIRLANEVSEHPETTEYVLPKGAAEGDDDKVTGAWWVGCNADINGKRYGFMHMTPPNHPTGQPVYSIRDYGRFGAFFETTVTPDEPLHVEFRIVLSPEPLDAPTCARLYNEYVQSLQNRPGQS